MIEVVAQNEAASSEIDFSKDPDGWLKKTDSHTVINDLMHNQPELVADKFSEIQNEEILKLFDNQDPTIHGKRKLWDILEGNNDNRKKLITALESETDLTKKNERYRDLWEALVIREDVKDSSGNLIGASFKKPDPEKRNQLMKILDKDQFQNIFKAVTKKNLELTVDFDAGAFGYELKNKDGVFTLTKDGKNYPLPETNLPDNLEGIKFKKLSSKEGYGVFYESEQTITKNGDYVKGNRVMLQEGYYLQSSENNEWKAKNIDPKKPEIVIGLDSQRGQVEVNPDGKVEMWGIGSDDGKNSVYVKMGDKKFFPSKVGPQVQDEKSHLNKHRYAFVEPLTDDKGEITAYHMKGNMQAKVKTKADSEIGVGVFVGEADKGIISFKERTAKEGETVLNILDAKGYKDHGLFIVGDALNGKVSFSVSEDMDLLAREGKITLQSSNDKKNHYSYTTRGGKIYQSLDGSTWKEYETVSRTDEVGHTIEGEPTNGISAESSRVERIGTGKTADGHTPSHTSEQSKLVINGRTISIPNEGNYAVSTESTTTTNTGPGSTDFK